MASANEPSEGRPSVAGQAWTMAKAAGATLTRDLWPVWQHGLQHAQDLFTKMSLDQTPGPSVPGLGGASTQRELYELSHPEPAGTVWGKAAEQSPAEPAQPAADPTAAEPTSQPEKPGLDLAAWQAARAVRPERTAERGMELGG